MLGQAGLNLIITDKTSRRQAGARSRGNMSNAEQLIGTGRIAGRTEPAVRSESRRDLVAPRGLAWHTRG